MNRIDEKIDKYLVGESEENMPYLKAERKERKFNKGIRGSIAKKLLKLIGSGHSYDICAYEKGLGYIPFVSLLANSEEDAIKKAIKIYPHLAEIEQKLSSTKAVNMGNY
jgi:hypothetical protein